MKTLHKTLTALAFSLAAFSLGLAQSADDIVKQVSANLSKSPWEANLVGKVQGADGSSQDADFKIQVIPGGDTLTRLEFKKPAALEGNFVLISDKEVWNYLFLTNQLIVQPRAKAKIEGLSGNVSDIGNFSKLADQINARLAGEENSAEGPAWKIVGTPKASGTGYATMEILVLKSDPRPVAMTIKDSAGKVLGSLSFSNFKRTNLSAKEIKKYPADAAVVKK